MATTALTPTILVMDTASADLADATCTDVATAADGWTIAAGLAHSGDRLLLKFVDDGSTATITVVAGDRPPSQRANLGNLSISMAASDVKYVCVDPARFVQSDGTILVTTDNESERMSAFLIPKGF